LLPESGASFELKDNTFIIARIHTLKGNSMLKKFILLSVTLASPAFSQSPNETALLRATVQALQQQNRTLESRVSELENKLINVSNAAAKAQTIADNAQTSANAAAKYSHSAGFYPSFAQLTAQHGGCSGADFSSPACHAAAHRYCTNQGYTSGLITEFDGSNAFVGCFR
jgi:hypothetical protein